MPRAVSRPTIALETGHAKLWMLLIGVNHYDDPKLPSLQYSAIDCQGLSEALTEATQAFPEKTIRIHHDFAAEPATLERVRGSLEEILRSAQRQDTVLVYFSGHGILDSNRPVLCLSETRHDALSRTGLSVVELLEALGRCAAKHQVIWLDACHSGGMTLRGMKTSFGLPNPTPQLMGMLGQKAAQSQGFYALLSCDQSQQSWEFPELGHGVFTYFLMRGLRGEAADAKGTIDADGLYKYVYHQTLQYIDKTNQQLRLINQQKRGRGETQLQPEYPLQTPKRIVEGIGELVLGVKSAAILPQHPRQAIVVETLPNHRLSIELSKMLRRSGSFDLSYYPQPGKAWSSVRETIQSTLQATEIETALIYLRGKLEETPEGDSWFVLGEGERLSRSWLRQELRRSAIAQHILILDCPGASSLADWVEDLRLDSDRGQCIIAASSPLTDSELLSQALIETLKAADLQTGLPVAGWIAQLQLSLAGRIPLQVWLSGAQGVIEVLPGQDQRSETSFDIGLCPYRGLQAFTEEDTQYFYGRESLTKQLLQLIQQQTCLAIVGASGSGKSSVVQAGLVAQLRQGKQIPDSDRWWIGRMKPGDRPLDSLVKALSDQADEQLQIEGLLHQGTEGFVQWLRSRPEPMALLVVDQFEELFTLSPAEDRRRFLAIALEALQYASDRFKLVLTLRADFIASGLEIPELAPILQRSSVFVPPCLADEEYRNVIVKPAEQVGLSVEAGLVELLLKELNRSPGDLPLLEFVLEQLWQNREDGKLTLKTYQQQIGGLHGALERKAQEIYDSLNSAEKDCARWIFLSLTQLGDNTEDTRRRVLKSDLAVAKYPEQLVDRTLGVLTSAKLIVMNTEEVGERGSKGDSALSTQHSAFSTPVTIEVAHEILIRHWSTLRWWLDENRNRLRIQRQIEYTAQQWKQHDRQSDFLLRGVRLAEAEELYVKYTDELSQEVQQFIEAGLEERDRDQLEAKRRLKRAQRVAVTISVLGLAATGLGGLALWNQRNAQIREIQALSSSSEALLNSDDQLESMIAAIRAGRQLQRMNQPWNFLPESVKMTAIATLQQAVSQTQETNRLEGHAEQVNAIIVSPDAQAIATASNDNLVKLWTAQGQFLKDLAGHRDRITSVAFSSGSSLIATASADRTIRIWNRDGKLLQTLTGHTDWVTDVQFNPKTQLLASASRDGTIKIWRLGTPVKEAQTLRGHRGWVNRIGFSPDGQQLVSGGEDGTVRVWKVGNTAAISTKRNSEETATFKAHRDRVTSVVFSPDGKQLATSGDNVAKRWTVDGKLLVTIEGHEDQVNSVQFSPDGKQLATGSSDRTARLFNLDGSAIAVLRGHGAAILNVSFSRNGTELMTASADKTARVWRTNFEPKAFNRGLLASAMSSDGKKIAIATPENTIQISQRDRDKISQSKLELKGHTSAITQISFNPNGNLIASSSDDRTIRLWDVNTGKLIATLTGHSDRVTAIRFRPDGTVLASGGADKLIKLWSVSNANLIDTLKGHDDEITALDFSPDGRLLASGSHDSTIRLWYSDSITPVILGRHKLAIAALTFSPDGKAIASSSWDNTIKLWSVETAKPTQEASPRQTLVGHNGGVLSLSFSPDSQILASGSDDNTIKLWNMTNIEPIKTLTGINDQINNVRFSGNGQTLLIASNNTGILLWDLNLATLLRKSCDRIQHYLHSKPDHKKLCS